MRERSKGSHASGKFAILIAGIVFMFIGTSFAEADAEWDKTFPGSSKVTHQKVSYPNRYGITISADMYLPGDMDRSHKYAAIIVGTPYGGVKEQTAGLYAQTMAERGYVAIAFDESFNGESGGTPRHISSPEIFVEDFSAAVDFIGTRSFVDREKIGVIGICGSGGFSIGAAQVDRRIKAVATVSMYDMSRVKAYGWNDSMTEKQRNAYLDKLGEQRWNDFINGEPALTPRGAPKKVDEKTDPIGREFYEYYSTPRGQHPRSITRFTITSDMAFMNFDLMDHIKSISPRPILFIMGEHAHSRYFTEDAYEMAADPKELYIVKGAGHVDLYDNLKLIPFDKLDSFFTEYLKKNGGDRMNSNMIFTEGKLAAEDYFTNKTWVQMLVTDEEKAFDSQVYNVVFEPSARTHWHSHPGGQILLVTHGEGYYQEKGKKARLLKKGDVVEIRPDVIHWHGASPDSGFTHIGMSTQLRLGPAVWSGPVTDSEYSEAAEK